MCHHLDEHGGNAIIHAVSYRSGEEIRTWSDHLVGEISERGERMGENI